MREERELARFWLHLIKHRSMLKHRVHSTLVNFGRPCPVTDLFGVEGRKLLATLDVPEPWRGNVAASVELIDDLERQVAANPARRGDRAARGWEALSVAPIASGVDPARPLAYVSEATEGRSRRFDDASEYSGSRPIVGTDGTAV